MLGIEFQPTAGQASTAPPSSSRMVHLILGDRMIALENWQDSIKENWGRADVSKEKKHGVLVFHHCDKTPEKNLQEERFL